VGFSEISLEKEGFFSFISSTNVINEGYKKSSKEATTFFFYLPKKRREEKKGGGRFI
jgi:hypothetical protein